MVGWVGERKERKGNEWASSCVWMDGWVGGWKTYLGEGGLKPVHDLLVFTREEGAGGVQKHACLEWVGGWVGGWVGKEKMGGWVGGDVPPGETALAAFWRSTCCWGTRVSIT